MMKKIKLAGQMFLKPESGDVVMLYGGWHETRLGNIKSSKVYDEVIRTHGKKEGKSIRLRLANTIMKNISFGKP